MNTKLFLLILVGLMSLSVYLFVEAPQPLLDAKREDDKTIPVNVLFDIVAQENGVMRSLYSQEIVGSGKAVGLAFSEDWRESGVDAGPLPALLLREASKQLEKNPLSLSLFLGSDFPIAASNAFSGIQTEKLLTIRQTRKPEYFYAADIQRHTAMYPDYAVAQPCVDCHNKHPDSPKKDWQLHDVMGATTWLYPDDRVAPGDLIKAVAALRSAFSVAYQAYLDKVAGFKVPPQIGEHWPRDGYYLPSLSVFMQAFEARASSSTVGTMVESLLVQQSVKTVSINGMDRAALR